MGPANHLRESGTRPATLCTPTFLCAAGQESIRFQPIDRGDLRPGAAKPARPEGNLSFQRGSCRNYPVCLEVQDRGSKQVPEISDGGASGCLEHLLSLFHQLQEGGGV